MTRSTSPLGSRQPPPLHVTLVHHDRTVWDFVAGVAETEGWRFDAYHDFAGAAGALDAALAADRDPPPANAPAVADTPHVFLAALRTPGAGACGLERTRRLRMLDASVRVVLVAEQADAARGFSAIYSGASAFILLPLSRDDLLTAVDRAAAGGRFISAAAVEPSLGALSGPVPPPCCTNLTPTETRVLWAMGQGRGEKLGAVLLNMEFPTFHTHCNHIYPKLGVHDYKDALHKYFGDCGCPYACLHTHTHTHRERERESRRRGDEARGRT